MIDTKTRTQGLVVAVVLVLILTAGGPATAQRPDAPPLAERGPYGVGVQTETFVDDSRDGRELVTEIWYPALIPEGTAEETTYMMFVEGHALRGAAPDTQGAPYPLILFSHGYGGIRFNSPYFAEHLASHGFVVAAMDHTGNTILDLDETQTPRAFVDRPLDVRFVLDQIAASDWAGLVDTDNVGVSGHSFGGYTALVVGGGQVDPAYYQDDCAVHPDAYWENNRCAPAEAWEAVAAYRAQFDTPGTDPEALSLWPSMHDARIRAVLAMAPWHGPAFGERGLAAVTAPTLIMGSTQDSVVSYERDALFEYAHLGAEERYLLSFIGADHNAYIFACDALTSSLAEDIIDFELCSDPVWDMQRFHDLVNHFGLAFFGYYLQGHADYAVYLSAEYVAGFNGLAWEQGR